MGTYMQAQMALGLALKYAEKSTYYRRLGLWDVARDYLAMSEREFEYACELELSY